MYNKAHCHLVNGVGLVACRTQMTPGERIKSIGEVQVVQNLTRLINYFKIVACNKVCSLHNIQEQLYAFFTPISYEQQGNTSAHAIFIMLIIPKFHSSSVFKARGKFSANNSRHSNYQPSTPHLEMLRYCCPRHPMILRLQTILRQILDQQ